MTYEEKRMVTKLIEKIGSIDKSLKTIAEQKEKPNKDGWRDAEDPPKSGEYVLLSFSNFPFPLVGPYEENEKDGGNYYIGDETALSQNIIVNGWMPLPKCRED